MVRERASNGFLVSPPPVRTSAHGLLRASETAGRELTNQFYALYTGILGHIFEQSITDLDRPCLSLQAGGGVRTPRKAIRIQGILDRPTLRRFGRPCLVAPPGTTVRLEPAWVSPKVLLAYKYHLVHVIISDK